MAAKKIDFRDLPVGARVMGGTIEVCPHCGKNGLEDRRDGIVRYIHSAEPSEQDFYDTKLDICPPFRPAKKD